jgi:hypothetical protein
MFITRDQAEQKSPENDMIKRERGGIGHISDVNMECWKECLGANEL